MVGQMELLRNLESLRCWGLREAENGCRQDWFGSQIRDADIGGKYPFGPLFR